MTDKKADRIGFGQLVLIWLIFLAAGAVIASPFELYRYVKDMDYYWFIKIPVALVMEVIILIEVAVLAALGALLMCIPLLLLRRAMPAAGTAAWVLACGAAGALIGALHPLILLSVIIDHTANGIRGVLRLDLLMTASAGVGGLFVGWWYRRSVLGREAAAARRESAA